MNNAAAVLAALAGRMAHLHLVRAIFSGYAIKGTSLSNFSQHNQKEQRNHLYHRA